jgi:hypothetical protein
MSRLPLAGSGKKPQPTKNFNRKIKTRTLQKPRSAAPEKAKTHSSKGLAIRSPTSENQPAPAPK